MQCGPTGEKAMIMNDIEPGCLEEFVPYRQNGHMRMVAAPRLFQTGALDAMIRWYELLKNV